MAVLSATLLTALCCSGCASNRNRTYRSIRVAPSPVAVRSADDSHVEQAPIPTGNLPRVMLLVDEKALGTIATAEVENMAMARLLKMKVRVIDRDMVRSNIKQGEQLLKLTGDAGGAAALGLQMGADVVIMGEAVSKPTAGHVSEESKLRSYGAVVTLKSVRTDNASLLASASESLSVPGTDDVNGSSRALKAAAKKTLDSLLPDTLRAWASASVSTGEKQFKFHMVITASGVDQLWKLKGLRETLRGMRSSLRNVIQRSYTTGIAEFEVDSALPAEELAEALVLHPPEDLKLQVLQSSSGQLKIKVVTVE